MAIIAGEVIWKIIHVRHRNQHRDQLMAQPVSAEWITHIEKNIPLYKRLPQELKTQLHGLVNVFLDEKAFVGCGE
ncbi:MAG: zinc-dependent peptidase, partial [Planctomycetota bacterium]